MLDLRRSHNGAKKSIKKNKTELLSQMERKCFLKNEVDGDAFTFHNFKAILHPLLACICPCCTCCCPAPPPKPKPPPPPPPPPPQPVCCVPVVAAVPAPPPPPPPAPVTYVLVPVGQPQIVSVPISKPVIPSYQAAPLAVPSYSAPISVQQIQKVVAAEPSYVASDAVAPPPPASSYKMSAPVASPSSASAYQMVYFEK
uniref:Leucine-rich repeat extensin-like protein 3 n=1 Tax=Ascaris lumbricoides TaxID=6252 RepID=A0A0M3HW79_ASCLU